MRRPYIRFELIHKGIRCTSADIDAEAITEAIAVEKGVRFVDAAKIPAGANKAIEKYLFLMDRKVPGWLTDFYIVGSLALDDYHDGVSDLDFVAVSDSLPSPENLSNIKAVHSELTREFAEPDFDGVYVLREQLRTLATEKGIASHQGGVFREGEAFNANPVTWRLLNTCAIVIRGDTGPEVYDDSTELRTWCKENLAGYWRSWTAKAKMKPPQDIANKELVWGVLGVARLHATIFSDRVISKSAAVDYADRTFDQRWSKLIKRVGLCRGRNAESANIDSSEKRFAIDFMEHVIADVLG